VSVLSTSAPEAPPCTPLPLRVGSSPSAAGFPGLRCWEWCSGRFHPAAAGVEWERCGARWLGWCGQSGLLVLVAVWGPRRSWRVAVWPLAAGLKCVSVLLQAQVRMRGAGLGAKGSSYGVSTADSYKDAVRKAMFARFTEME